MTEHVPIEGADHENGGGSSTRSRFLGRWAAFFAASAVFAALTFGVLPTLPRLLAMEAQTQLIKDSGIRAGAWFYTEVEQIPMLESLVRDSMRATERARADAAAGGK